MPDQPMCAVVPIHAAGKVGHVSQPSPSAARPLPSTLLTAFHAGNPGSRRHLREGDHHPCSVHSTPKRGILWNPCVSGMQYDGGCWG